MTRRRGYILVVVLLLTLVVGLMAGVGLKRQAAQSLTVARQADAYRDHHATKGMQEAIGAWVRTMSRTNVADALGDNGHAFDIQLPDGSVIAIHVFDGQGLALADLGGVPAATQENAGKVLKNLALTVEDYEFDRLVRPGGPSEISVMSAPQEVLRAVLLTAMPPDRVDVTLTRILEQRRASDGFQRADLNTIGAEANLTQDERAVLNGLLTFDPELWWVTAVARHSIRGTTARYGGLVVIRAGRTRTNQDPSGTFLSWEDLGVGADHRDPPAGIPDVR